MIQGNKEMKSVLDALYLCSGPSPHESIDAQLVVRHVRMGLRDRTT